MVGGIGGVKTLDKQLFWIEKGICRQQMKRKNWGSDLGN
jgi:hypothetical protein